MYKFFLLFFLFLSYFGYSKTLKIDSEPIYETKKYISYSLVDCLNEKPPFKKAKVWSKTKETFNTPQNRTKPYWVKIELKNISNQPKTYYLKAENQFTYHIDYYLVKDKKVVKHIQDGVISKNRARAFNVNHIIFPLTLKPQEEATAYLKIRNYNKIDLNFLLVNEDYLLDYYQTYNIVEGIFFGGMLLMLLYNLFLYFLLRFKFYLYYVSYVFWLTIYFVGLFGFSQRYFPEHTLIFHLSSGAFFISLNLFVQSILNLKEKLPKIYSWLNLFNIYFVIATLMNIYALEEKNFFYAQLLFNLFFMVVPVFIFIIISTTYYLAFFKKDKIAQFYSIIWTCIAFFGSLLPLEYLNIVTFPIPSDYIVQFIILIEVLCFSFILAYKIKLIEKKKKEQEKLLVQQNKLASMGEMISMIAHQWRQPLSEINGTVISMDIDYRKEQLTNTKFNTYLDNIENTTAYMSNTINDFMDFFKHNKSLEKLDILDIIKTAQNLLSVKNSHKIDIDYKKSEKIIFEGYKSELIQILLIVLNNAIDATLLTDREPHITIATTKHKRTLIISITDNGYGIDKNILDKIYDPYFTTKHQSKGTGLGLYILKMIVEQRMKGKVEINSSESGTVCNILIPLKVSNKYTF